DVCSSDLPVWRRRLVEHAGADIESAETPDTVAREGAQDSPVVQHRVMPEAEEPRWPRELGVQRAERTDVPGLKTVEVPPPGAIRDELHAVAGDPERLDHRLVTPADHLARIAKLAGRIHLRHPQLGSVPRHVGMPPREARQAVAVRPHARRGPD